MKIIFYILLLFLSACSDGTDVTAFTPAQINGSTIKIASFNIAELGNEKMDKDFEAIAKMINRFDLIALQEVQDTGGKEAVMNIYTALNKISGNSYALPLVIPNSGKGFPGIEGYAFIYRDPVALDNRVSPVYDFRSDDHDIYGRIPGFAHFKAGTFDFVVATVHLQWGNIDRRAKEVMDIKQWLIEYANRSVAEERDLIIVGDFNRYGDGKPKGNLTDAVIDSHNAPFDSLVDFNELAQTYRLISLEFLPTLYTRFASLDAQSTTIATENALYDQIMISAGSFREYTATPSLFGEDIGVVAFDMEAPWTEKKHEEIKAAISDHRPIWARFRIDLGDDDG